MAHPFASHRQNDVERSRVAHVTKGYATGGGVGAAPESNPAVRKKAVKQRDAQAVEGGSAKERMDRPGRARGGRAPKHKGNNVNVIVAPQGGAHAPMAPGMPPPGVAGGPGPMPPLAAMAPRPPMLPPPGAGGPPMGGPGPMPPPGMPPRSAGGRTYASGGAVFEQGKRNGTQVQNNPSGKNDQKNVGRGKVVTFKTGGAVEASAKMGPKFGGGAGGGTARIQKEERAEKKYAKAK
jgi:hypothetical protein